MNSGRGEKTRHLGRGLEALLGPITATPVSTPPTPSNHKLPADKDLDGSLQQLALELISPNPYQPRTSWNEADLAELADSIRANGVVQPIIVRPSQNGYQLIAGERRFRAARMAARETIPALVRQVTDEQLFEWSLVENIHRRDLNPIERAKAYQRYLGAFSLTQSEAAQRLGEDRSVIANFLRLLDLPEDMRQMLVDGRLTMGHARAILSLPSDELRRKLANRAMAGRLSVRDVERLVRLHTADGGAGPAKVRSKAPHIVDLEQKLCRHLGTRVSIETRKNGHRGKILIEFDSLDEFDRISEALGLGCREGV